MVDSLRIEAEYFTMLVAGKCYSILSMLKTAAVCARRLLVAVV